MSVGHGGAEAGLAVAESQLPAVPAPLHPQRPQLQALTGVRFAAALLVVCLHVRHTLEGRLPAGAAQFIASGQVGVTLFFILSGFILTYTYLGPDGTFSASRRSFWAARLARIYPVYLFALLLGAPFFIKTLLEEPNLSNGAALLLTPALLQAWLPQTACIWNCPGWSLSAEALFYALFPLALGGVAWWFRRGWALWAGLAVLWTLTLLPPLLYLLLADRPLPAESLVIDTFYYGPLFRLPEFLAGMLLGWHFLNPAAARARSFWVSPGLWSIVGLGAAVLIMVYAHLLVPPFLRNVLIVPALALLLWGLAHGQGWLARAFSWGPLVLLGEASYSLYILHVPVYLWLSVASARLWPGQALGLGFFLVYLALLIPFSVAVYLYLERPAQRALRAGWRTRRNA